ncbi:M28 family metallopeptidase [soil metagenome]
MQKLSVLVLVTAMACAPPSTTTPPKASGAVPLPDAPAIAASLANEVGPRLAGSAGDQAAVAWGLRTMRALGLSAVHSEPVMVPVWRRISEEASLGGAQLAVTALGGSPSTSDGGMTAEVVVVHSLDEVTAAPADAYRGRIVFFDVAIARARDGSGYGAGAKIRVLGPAAASGKGALAVLVRSVGTAGDDAPHMGVTKDPDAPTVAIPSAALGALSSDRLARAVAQDKSTKILLKLRTERLPDATSANVIGDVRAKGANGGIRGIVLLGAHLDSWDLARGAIDDGCGVGAVLDAAARIAREGGAKRVVRVVLFAAEENSGAGAKAYAAAHATELHVSATEMDAGCGAPYEARVLAGPSAATTALTAALAHAIDPLPIAEAPAEGGSDVQPLRLLGVPIIDVRQDMSLYFDIHHSRRDTPDAIAASDLRLSASALANVARAVANFDGALAPIPDDRRTRSH